MKKLIETVLGFVMTVVMGFLFAFVLINFMLNCQSWDESYWTETSSCITVSQILGID